MYSPCALFASMQKNAKKATFLMTVTPPVLCVTILSLLPCLVFLVVLSFLCARSSPYRMTLPSMSLTILLSCRFARSDKSHGENQVDALRCSRLPSTERLRAGCQSPKGSVEGRASSTALTEAVATGKGSILLGILLQVVDACGHHWVSTALVVVRCYQVQDSGPLKSQSVDRGP